MVKMSLGENKLEEIRKRIDEIDDNIADLLSKRMRYAKQARDEKVRMNKPVVDRRREEEVIEKWRAHARGNRRSGGYDLSEEMMKKLAEIITEYTLKKEMGE